MKRHSPIMFAAAVLLMAAPLAFAQPTVPFGVFDGQVRGGNGATGVIALAGWALDDDGVESVDVYVDGLIAGRATYGGFRPGVAARSPGFPDAGAAGFGFRLDTTHYINGLHTVNALVTSSSGQQRWLNPLVFEFVNTTHLLKPFGVVELPLEDAELYGTCNVNDPQRRLSVVEGWALDVGVEAGDLGVGYVELLVDGSIIFNSRLDCHYVPALGGPTDCYGVRRLDIERAFPLVKDSPHAGFRFVLDVGDLWAFGFVEGQHVLTIRAGDVSGQVTQFGDVPVTFRCDDYAGNEASFGGVDLPAGGLFFGGSSVEITGYAVDYEGVARVDMYVDGALVGTATLGIPRPAVAASFPGYPGVGTAGWSFELDPTPLSDGFHQLQVIVVDDDGFTQLIGERTFKVHNP